MSLVHTQKRPGEPLDTSPNKEHRETEDLDESTEDLNLADFGIPPWGDKHYRLNVNREDRDRAIHYPTLGWPSFEEIFGNVAGTHLAHRVFDAKPLRYPAPDTRFERMAGVDPVSPAPSEAGA